MSPGTPKTETNLCSSLMAGNCHQALVYNIIKKYDYDCMPKQDFEKFAGPIEDFTAGIILNRTKQKYPFDNITIRPRKTWHEDHALKCDFFLQRNGKDWIAFDAKSPKGIKGNIDWDNHWVCPFDTFGNKRDVSLEIKIENPDVQDRFLVYTSKDSLILVSSTRLAEWLSRNVYPDFHEWNDNRELFKENIKHADPSKRTFMVRKNETGKEKLLTTITHDELLKIGSNIKLTVEEEDEWFYVLQSLT